MPVLCASSTRPCGSLERLTSVNSSAAGFQQALDAGAEAAGLGRVNGYLAHYFIKYSTLARPPSR